MSEAGREVLKEISFLPPRPPKQEMREMPEPYVENTDREEFYQYFRRLRAPSDGNMPAVNVEMLGWQRIADTMWELGYRIIPEVATLKWTPTPGMGDNNSMDAGKFYKRNADGSWPAEAVAAELSMDDIKVHPLADGTWVAIHDPTGISATGKTKLEANRLAIEELEKMLAESQASE